MAADDLIDPYWTLIGYFNSLRELGGALRLGEDDVREKLTSLPGERGIGHGRLAPPGNSTADGALMKYRKSSRK